jgi:hypothetical protein
LHFKVTSKEKVVPDPDFKSILEDVRTIKSILQATDAPLPPIWYLMYWVASPALVLIGLLKFFVPPLAAMSFLETLLWLWAPVLTLVILIVAIKVMLDIRRVGTRFLAQGRIQTFFYTRLIVAPTVVTLGYLLSLNTSYSLEGAMLILVAVAVTEVIVLVPGVFRPVPLVFLFGGFVELILGLRGPLWTLVNTWAVAATLAFVGSLLQKNEDRPEANRG